MKVIFSLFTFLISFSIMSQSASWPAEAAKGWLDVYHNKTAKVSRALTTEPQQSNIISGQVDLRNVRFIRINIQTNRIESLVKCDKVDIMVYNDTETYDLLKLIDETSIFRSETDKFFTLRLDSVCTNDNFGNIYLTTEDDSYTLHYSYKYTRPLPTAPMAGMYIPDYNPLDSIDTDYSFDKNVGFIATTYIVEQII